MLALLFFFKRHRVTVSRTVTRWYPDKIPPEKIHPEKNPPENNPLNAVEREPAPTRVLNPNAREASYKPKQRSYRKTKLKKRAIVRHPKVQTPKLPAPKRTRTRIPGHTYQ